MEPMDSGAQPMSSELICILFVCMGNICRSPALEAVFTDLCQKKGIAHRFYVESSALTTHYLGRQADPRICKAALNYDITIDHIAQLFKPSDFQRFDYIFAVSTEVADQIKDLATTAEERRKVHLATEFSKKFPQHTIPDPYYLGTDAFDHVMQMCIDSCQGILEKIP